MKSLNRHPSGRALSVVSLVLAVFGLVVFAGVGPAAAKEAPGTYHCSAWKNGVRNCAKFSVFKENFKTDYTRTMFNKYKKQTISFTPLLTVTPSAGLAPSGQTVTVTGSGYNPAQPMYLIYCRDVPVSTVTCRPASSRRSCAC